MQNVRYVFATFLAILAINIAAQGPTQAAEHQRGRSGAVERRSEHIEQARRDSSDAKKPNRRTESVAETGAKSDVKEGRADHRNKIDDRPATLYAKYDGTGKFLKWGVTYHEEPKKRYTAAQIGENGEVRRLERGPRREMLAKERDLVERDPGPENRERWAGKRRGELQYDKSNH